MFALALVLASALSLLELAIRPEQWVGILSGSIFVFVATPIAWRLGPRLSPRASYQTSRVMLVLAAISSGITMYNWRSTPAAGAMGLAMTLVVVFGATFFDRREVHQLVVLESCLVVCALLIDGFIAEDILIGGLTIVTVAVIGLVISSARATADRLAYTDPLTGASNRRDWDLVVADAVGRHRRTRQHLAMILIDLDHFKRINDTAGHERGDEVLVESVAAWRCCIRATDTLARLGGDEFGVLLPECGLDDAREVGKRLLAASAGIGTSCSIGVAAVGPGGDATLIQASADQQLYRSKAGGRARLSAAEVMPAPAA